MRTNKIIYIFIISLIMVACEPVDTQSDSNYDPELKLKELGIELSTPSSPVANYVNSVRSGNLLFISGKGPLKNDGNYIKGKVGSRERLIFFFVYCSNKFN